MYGHFVPSEWPPSLSAVSLLQVIKINATRTRHTARSREVDTLAVVFLPKMQTPVQPQGNVTIPDGGALYKIPDP